MEDQRKKISQWKLHIFVNKTEKVKVLHAFKKKLIESTEYLIIESINDLVVLKVKRCGVLFWARNKENGLRSHFFVTNIPWKSCLWYSSIEYNFTLFKNKTKLKIKNDNLWKYKHIIAIYFRNFLYNKSNSKHYVIVGMFHLVMTKRTLIPFHYW